MEFPIGMKKHASYTLTTLLILFSTHSIGADRLSLTTGLDVSQGDFGQASTTTTSYVPFIVKYETGPIILKVNVPWIRSTGLVNVDTGSSVSTTKKTEEGLGDPTLSFSYAVLQENNYGVDLGIKVKIATTEKSKTLITTGENDYSFQADGYRIFGKITTLGTLGWTKKGEPSNTAFRDPWYTSLGIAYAMSPSDSIGIFYDYRQRISSHGSNRNEVTGYMSHRFDEHWKLQVYALTGFSNASPDFGVGTMLGYSF